MDTCLPLSEHRKPRHLRDESLRELCVGEYGHVRTRAGKPPDKAAMAAAGLAREETRLGVIARWRKKREERRAQREAQQ